MQDNMAKEEKSSSFNKIYFKFSKEAYCILVNRRQIGYKKNNLAKRKDIIEQNFNKV